MWDESCLSGGQVEDTEDSSVQPRPSILWLHKMTKIDRRRPSPRGNPFWFHMTKHCRDPEDQSLDKVSGWIEGSTYNLRNWLTPRLAVFWVIFETVRGVSTRLARIKTSHPLFAFLDEPSTYCESIDKCTNWLMWEGNVNNDKEIKVTHFGPIWTSLRKPHQRWKDCL